MFWRDVQYYPMIKKRLLVDENLKNSVKKPDEFD